ncbi:MAG: hypothetical protein ABFS45_13910 [Pseudomonadota bacterium]
MTTGIAYKFIVQGTIVETPDARTAIQLNKNERDLVLSEMRVFLQSVQQITSGITKDDMEQVTKSARKSGRSAQVEVPGSLVGKLPLEFKKLGFDTHTKFDELALDAEQLGDSDHTLLQLNALLENCVSCHSAYRFEVGATVLN